MTYEYQIAGIRIALQLPFDISVQRSSQAFLTASTGERPDMRFVCRPAASLPVPPVDGHEEDNRCYAESDGARRVFFRPSPTGPPYACVTWRIEEPEVLRCDYLQGQVFRLNYSMKLCDMLGLESLLLRFNGLILHSSFIRWQNRGILFSADSGVGKSTQADLWVRHRGAEILNGDRAGLRRRDGVWMAYGLPYAGSSLVYRNEAVPVTTVFMLEQAPENDLRILTPGQALRRLYPQVTIHSWDADFVRKALTLIEDLISSVPVYLLRCRPDEGAVDLAGKVFSADYETGKPDRKQKEEQGICAAREVNRAEKERMNE